jgi:hypothetical protein
MSDKNAFEANFERIFGAPKPIERGTFVQDPITKKFVLKGTENTADKVDAPTVMRGIEAFKSPIDGSIIASRKQLAEHNKKHGVTNASDYSSGYIEKKAYERVNKGQKWLKDTRRTDINEAFNRHR